MTAWNLLRVFVERGHHLAVCLLLPSTEDGENKVRLNILEKLGVKVVPITIDPALVFSYSPQNRWRNRLNALQRSLQPRLSDYYPSVRFSARMESILKSIQPDVIFAYHWQGVAVTHGLKMAPRMAVLGDPVYLVSDYRDRLKRQSEAAELSKTVSIGEILSQVRNRVDALRHPRFMIELLSECEKIGFFAAHHAEWVRNHGIPQCSYFRTPIPDEAGSEWEELRAAHFTREKPKLLLIGHLQGTATLSGLYLFAKETLPILERKLGPDGFEVHLVGGETPPPELSRLLNRPSVLFRGHIEYPHNEFLSSDVLVVPTPIDLGIRVRILVGWSFGCCVVAHQANALGIPEMAHEKNALLAAAGRDLAESIIRALKDISLRKKLQKAGRQTYEEFFSLSIAGRKIVEELESISCEPQREELIR